MAFLAVGRCADVSRLNLEAANLAPGPKGELLVDDYGRTSTPTVYAVGDVSGAPMLANQATAQARVLPTPQSTTIPVRQRNPIALRL